MITIKNKTQVIITLMISASMASIDRSIVNISLPAIRRDFGVDMNQIEWVVTAYMLTYLLSIPLMNWLKTVIGYYRLLLGCLALFTLGSLFCSLSTNLETLVIARMVQAAAGGTIAPMSLAILSEYLPKEERGSAIGWWGMGNVMGPAIGPTIGGVLTELFGWPAVFYINLPIGIIALLMTVRYMNFLVGEPVYRPKFDRLGYLWFSAFIIFLQMWVTSLSSNGIVAIKTLVYFSLTALTLKLFIQSAKRTDPLMDLSVFRISGFNYAAIVTFIRSIALFGGMFYLPFLLQGQLQYTEMYAGFLMLPNALMMLATRPIAGKLADMGRIRSVSMIGISIVAISFVWFAYMDAQTNQALVIFVMAIRGLGMGLLVAPVSTALINAVEPHQTASATSMSSLLLQLGGSLGIAISGVFHSVLHSYYMQQVDEESAEKLALKGCFIFSAIIIALALLPAARLPHAKREVWFWRKKVLE